MIAEAIPRWERYDIIASYVAGILDVFLAPGNFLARLEGWKTKRATLLRAAQIDNPDAAQLGRLTGFLLTLLIGPRAPSGGALSVVPDDAVSGMTRTVRRWMSQEEFDAMVKAGRVLPDSSGGKYILNEAAGSAVPGAVRPGSVLAEFEISVGSRGAVTDASKGWEYLYTDRTVRGRLDAVRGNPAPGELPVITNPRIVGRN